MIVRSTIIIFTTMACYNKCSTKVNETSHMTFLCTYELQLHMLPELRVEN